MPISEACELVMLYTRVDSGILRANAQGGKMRLAAYRNALDVVTVSSGQRWTREEVLGWESEFRDCHIRLLTLGRSGL